MSTLTTACPQISLYHNQSDLNLPSPPEETLCNAEDLATSLHPVATTVIEAPGNWSSAFHSWLEATAPPFSARKPTLVTFFTPLLRFPLDYDDPAFVATFGRILRLREDVRRLAATVLYSMSMKYALDLDVSKPDIQGGKFYGAHLRTAKDAAVVGWPGYDEQASNYLSSAVANNLSLVYLTTGNPPDVVRFTEFAANMSIEVATKTELLSEEGFEEEMEEMEKLTWDQRGLIDFEVLLRSSVFGGMFESSFSWNCALRRHVVVGKGKWETIGPGKQGVGNGKGRECFKDSLSAIFGPVELGIRWNFPLALWP